MPQRPTSITVLAVIGVVFGVLGVLCSPFAVLGAAMEGGELPGFFVGGGGTYEYPPALNAIIIASSIVGFFNALILLGGSIASFSLKPIARPLMNTYAGIAVINTIISSVGQLIIIMPEMTARVTADSNLPPEAAMVSAFIGGLIGMLCSMIYPICVMIYYNNERARVAFATGGMADVYTPPYQQPYPPQAWGGYQQPQQPGYYPPQESYYPPQQPEYPGYQAPQQQVSPHDAQQPPPGWPPPPSAFGPPPPDEPPENRP